MWCMLSVAGQMAASVFPTMFRHGGCISPLSPRQAPTRMGTPITPILKVLVRPCFLISLLISSKLAYPDEVPRAGQPSPRIASDR